MSIDKNIIKQRLVEGKHYGIYADDRLIDPKFKKDEKEIYANEYDERLDKIVDDLCDITNAVVFPLDKIETYIIRCRCGIFGEESLNYRNIAKQIGASVERTRQKEEKARGELYWRLKRMKYDEPIDKPKMSFAIINQIYKNSHIFKTGFTRNDFRMRIYPTFTISNFISYSKKEIEKMGFKPKFLNELVEKIHSMGLKFIDELTDEEKRQIVTESSEEMINNSSAYWITNLDKNIINCLKREDNCTIGGLKEFMANGGCVNQDAIDYAMNLGIDLTKIKISKDNSSEELLAKLKKLKEEKIDLEQRESELDFEINFLVEQINSLEEGREDGQSR